ncbi:MAG: response regulator transcription factor [Candidatus Obscuribacterales bacterium]|nr:response regulator transcription factor [Candidatus Obscuribacterales bacterium]
MTRLGLRMFLESSKNIKVVGEAGDGLETLRLVEELKPDVVLMDVAMPEMDGIEAARQLREKFPELRIVMMTSSKDEDDIFAALSAGVNGYCTKEVSDDRLLTAIATVVRGDLWLDASVAAKVMQIIPNPSSAADTGHQELSERELEVLKLIVEGVANSEIAKRLYISPNTVKSHIKHVLDKLSVSDRTQAAVKAIREGLV